MAKREIKRAVEQTKAEPEVVAPAAAKAEPVKVDLPPQNQARPVVVPSGIITVKAPAIVVVRILKGVCLYQDGVNVRRMPIKSGEPVTITIKQ